MKALEALTAGNNLLKKFHNLEQELVNIHKDLVDLKTEVVGMRAEQLRLEGRVSRLEENRETLLAKMELIATKAEAELKVALANAVSELKSDNSRYQAELYKKFLEAQQPRLLYSKGDDVNAENSAQD
jgi:hypothetical protein